MTHAYSFFLFALFLRLTVAWHANPRWATTLALGGVLGLVVLVRPINGVVVLAFLLYRDATLPRWRDKLDLLARQRLPLLAALGMSCAVLLPQLAYWKYSTGSWVYYSYQHHQQRTGRSSSAGVCRRTTRTFYAHPTTLEPLAETMSDCLLARILSLLPAYAVAYVLLRGTPIDSVAAVLVLIGVGPAQVLKNAMQSS